MNLIMIKDSMRLTEIVCIDHIVHIIALLHVWICFNALFSSLHFTMLFDYIPVNVKLSEASGTSLGYGSSRVAVKIKAVLAEAPVKDNGASERGAEEGIVAVPWGF